MLKTFLEEENGIYLLIFLHSNGFKHTHDTVLKYYTHFCTRLISKVFYVPVE